MPNDKEQKKHLNISLPLDIAQNVEKIAHMKKKSKTDIIREALEQYIADNTIYIRTHDEVFPVVRVAKKIVTMQADDKHPF